VERPPPLALAGRDKSPAELASRIDPFSGLDLTGGGVRARIPGPDPSCCWKLLYSVRKVRLPRRVSISLACTNLAVPIRFDMVGPHPASPPT
jgi:hypothetical protein